jgi:ParB family transcriptional regulator, chromosome partitioning protein
MPEIFTKPLSWFKLDPGQPRKTFDDADLRDLGNSLKKKQLQPVLAKPDGTLVVGERRFRAAQIVGLATLEVILVEGASDSQIRSYQLVENVLRADLTGYELWMASAELMSMNPGWQLKDLAEHLSLSQATITRNLSPSKLSEDWQEALKAGKVTLSACYNASKADKSKHAGLLALALSGANREAIYEAGRTPRAPKPDAVRMSRVVCPLSSGTKVTVSGEEMDLEAVIEALQSALDAARKANKDSLDVKTAERVWRDRAKAG